MSVALRGGAGDMNGDDGDDEQKDIDYPEEDPDVGYDVRVDDGESSTG